MAIYKADGTPYELNQDVRAYKPNSPEQQLLDEWDQEQIERNGAPLEYFDVFIDSNSIDPLYIESRNKVYSPIPIILWGFNIPNPSTFSMGIFGPDGADEALFEFNHAYLMSKLGFLPKPGARIFSPQKRENWVVEQSNTEISALHKIMRVQVFCHRFQESRTTSSGKVTQKSPGGYAIDSIKDLGS